MSQNDPDNVDRKDLPADEAPAPPAPVPAEPPAPAVEPADAVEPAPLLSPPVPPGQADPEAPAQPPAPPPLSDEEWIERTDRLAVGEREGDYSAMGEMSAPGAGWSGVEETREGQPDEPQDQAALPPGHEYGGVIPPGHEAEAAAEAQAGPTEESQVGAEPAGGTEGTSGEGGYEYSHGHEGVPSQTTEGDPYGQYGQYGYDANGQPYTSPEAQYGYNPSGEGEVSASGEDPSALAAQPPSAITPSDEEDEDDGEGGPKMTLGEHLEELRTRIIRALIGLSVAMVLTVSTAKWIIGLLTYPYDSAMEALNRPQNKLILLKAVGGFTIYFQIALVAGLIISAPWIFYQLWMFVAAGLYKHERRYVKMTVPFSAALFIGGALFYMFVAARPMMIFLTTFNEWLGFQQQVTLDSHIDLVTTMMLVFGVAFQMPLLVLILNKVGIMSLETLKYYRRHAIVFILIFAAICTPPSPVDQLVLAVPMYLLYELGVMLVILSDRKRKKQEADEGKEGQPAD